MTIAFFDFDRTLIASNSGSLWVRRELADGFLTHAQALRAALWLAGYHLGLGNLDDAVGRAIATLAGTQAEPLRSRTERFYREEVARLYRPGGLHAVERHRRSGDRLVLLTSSTEYLSRLVVAELGFDGYLCNRLEVDAAGLHTGRTVGGLCFGPGKLRHAENYARERGVPLGACAFYTDSYSDRFVLAEVGNPVAVNPDPRLKRLALRNRWAVVDWGNPPS